MAFSVSPLIFIDKNFFNFIFLNIFNIKSYFCMTFEAIESNRYPIIGILPIVLIADKSSLSHNALIIQFGSFLFSTHLTLS